MEKSVSLASNSPLGVLHRLVFLSCKQMSAFQAAVSLSKTAQASIARLYYHLPQKLLLSLLLRNGFLGTERRDD